jgi:hypothetical protein
MSNPALTPQLAVFVAELVKSLAGGNPLILTMPSAEQLDQSPKVLGAGKWDGERLARLERDNAELAEDNQRLNDELTDATAEGDELLAIVLWVAEHYAPANDDQEGASMLERAQAIAYRLREAHGTLPGPSEVKRVDGGATWGAPDE